MRDQPNLEELSGVLTVGLLAEGMVFASGRLLRNEPLEPGERAAAERGKKLLEFIAAPTLGQPSIEGMSYLASDTGALETLRAIRTQAPNQDVSAFLKGLARVLDSGLQGKDVSAKTNELDALQQIFVSLGRFALARANSSSRSPEDLIATPIG